MEYAIRAGKTHLTEFLTLLMFFSCFSFCCAYAGGDLDSDRDGLSDFQEVNKYLTDPKERDTDGDGVGDGDWKERREYTYSVRSILQFMPPLDNAALNDDFQDARVLKERDDYVELEVIHYPLGTAGKSVEANPNWQADYAEMTEYLKPGITTNWDAGMKQDLLDELRADGIIIDKLTDKQVVEQVSTWLMRKSRALNEVFTTYYIHYPDGKPGVYPGLEDAFEREFNRDKKNYDWTIEQHLEHELLGKGMFYNKTRGSCTSSAVYLTTVLRALGIPTRMIIVIPVIDPSDERQPQLVRERITHNQVRKTILAKKPGQGFSAHTLNEVYVGKRWHRLNYSELEPQHPFGLSTHLYTFNDLSEVNLAPTWGWRYGKDETSVVFKHDNPYSVIGLSDLFGCHSNIPNPLVPIKEQKHLTISKAYWFHSNQRPAWIPDDAVAHDKDGHILFHVDEWLEGEGLAQYKTFYSGVDKAFLLKSEGHADVRANAERGYWNQEFYVRIPEKEYTKMAAGVPYSIHPVNSNRKCQWKLAQGVTIRKLGE
jgi:hypothetical protein